MWAKPASRCHRSRQVRYVKRLVLETLLWSAVVGFLILCFVFPLEWMLAGAAVFAVGAVVFAASVEDSEGFWHGFLTWLDRDYGDY